MTTAQNTGQHVAHVLRGGCDLQPLEREVDGLACRLAAGVTGGAAWTLGSALVDAERAWGVVVRDADDRLTAAAFFVDEMRDTGPVVTLAGSDGGFRVALLAADEPAGEVLASTVAAEVRRRGAGIEFGPVTGPYHLLRNLADRLPACDLEASEPIPQLRREESVDLESYLSHGMRRTLRKARNRMASDGVLPRVEFLSDATEVAAVLPAMEDAYRNRDHEAGRASLLDSDAGRHAWRQRVNALVGSGCGEVAVLYLDDVFTAYVLGVRDGSWYGVREGRFRTEAARYAPGRVLEAEVVAQVLADPDLDGVDWLTGVGAESLLVENASSVAMRIATRSLAGVGVELPRPRASEDARDPLSRL
jgi:CelD/BcsL family acetyltransferase involved in cellulose biosynthesis